MSLSVTTNRVVYTGNGSASSFSVTFAIFSQDHLVVLKETISTGAVSTLALTTDYTVNAALNSVTLVAGALSSLYRLLILRTVPLTQLTDIRNQGTFYPETHEQTFDYLTEIDQQQQRQVDRSLKVAEADYSFDPILPRVAANKLFQINASANGINLIDEADVAATPAAPTIFGSTGTPRSIVAATGIVAASSHMSVSTTNQIIFVESSISGETIVSANPQIQGGTVIGQMMFLVGADDTDYITLNDGTGLALNGPWSSLLTNVLTLFWNGTVWCEMGRKS